jgi:hypothetical protein
VAWVSNNTSATAGFLEFTGAGLSALDRALAEKQEQMATMGARMLRPPRSGVESAETARIYQSAESGTLGSIAKSGAESFTTLLDYWLDWQGVESGHGVTVELNTDFMDVRLDATSMTALIQAWMGGAISYDTLFHNLQQGEIIPDNILADDERDKIDLQGPSSSVIDVPDSGISDNLSEDSADEGISSGD